MATSLNVLSLSDEARRRLAALSIRSVEALVSRLRDEQSAQNLGRYLGLSREELQALRDDAELHAEPGSTTRVRRNMGGALIP